ncbi:MAG: holo-ACP synthase [Streptococcaceae bacterium]|jgi:holo-[acyl-carrier protein] synthase|nr:holo-ACP synthase [Streptococcaceae bacterium]
MIKGIGVDTVELSRIAQAIKNRRFVEKVLTEPELAKFDKLTSSARKTELLAGRWAAKEAYAKAYGTGISSQLHFLDLTVENDVSGDPFFAQQPYEGKVHLSISHTGIEATAFVVLEK